MQDPLHDPSGPALQTAEDAIAFIQGNNILYTRIEEGLIILFGGGRCLPMEVGGVTIPAFFLSPDDVSKMIEALLRFRAQSHTDDKPKLITPQLIMPPTFGLN